MLVDEQLASWSEIVWRDLKDQPGMLIWMILRHVVYMGTQK